ncbi:MAG: ATP synthase F1 subunit gamma [Candidatus Aminicenantes bacterium]|nr:ATP synthase F1 subunit gamma [Candidatus Aminicenantes bacterium]
MPNLIDLRRRIRSVRNTQQVTKAMKTVATAKYKKASRSVAVGRPLWHSAPASAGRLAFWAGPNAHPLLDIREEQSIDVLVLTSDKGLCGAFNANLLAKALEFLKSKEPAARIRLELIGKKAVHFFKRQEYQIDRVFADHTDKLTPADLKKLAGELMEKFLFRETDAVYEVYNEFKSVLTPKIMIVRILPIATGTEAGPDHGLDPDWEPRPFPLISALWPRYVEAQIVHAFAESQAAEQAARMMAMDSASNNAEDLIEDLTLNLNKARQAGITKELLEIMTAVDALKS